VLKGGDGGVPPGLGEDTSVLLGFDERVVVVHVVGDSMAPTLNPADRILVDTADRLPSPPGMFVIWDGLGLVVRRVEYIAHSAPAVLRVSSDNRHYASYECSLDEAQIRGRVIARWQWV